MAVLHPELSVYGIVVRLPARDIGRCKCVCRIWRTLISTHGFETIHCTFSSSATCQKTLLTQGLRCSVHSMNIATGDHGHPSMITFPYQPGQRGISVLGHINGVLCVCLQPSHELILWNPTTGAYHHLTTTGDAAAFNYVQDTIALYNTEDMDLNVLHVIISRSASHISAKIYSRHSASWRHVPFNTKPKYAKRRFMWSVGTLCRTNVYFTVSNFWDDVHNVIIRFDTMNEQVTELCFPPVPMKSIFEGFLLTAENKLHMILLTTTHNNHDKYISIWLLTGESWSPCFSTPPIVPISSSTWMGISHYIKNGTWFIMSGSEKVSTFPEVSKHLDAFYATDWFHCNQGALYNETIVSPTYRH